MATVLDKKAPADKFATAVDEQIAQATSRIRVHDLAFGGLLLAAMLLVYATGMILLDKYAVLPEWVRQLALFGFLAAAAGTAYWSVVRPFRRRINPLYAAVQVEKTIDDAKNSVAGYVEAQEKGDVHPAVKAAMGARAARTAADADVNRAVDHRSLIYAGAVAVVFLLALIVLFFVFRPTQFGSLVSRAFAPFSSDAIKTRTQLDLLEPVGGDTTITTGQSVTVKVHVGGKVPDPENPNRVRVMLRHNPAAPEYEELPMEKGENSREWQVRVPDYLVRNGFWYKVAGGDAETAEYRVSVRSLPLFTGYEVSYEYPAYTRLKPETRKDPHIEAIRGTKVTVTGRTNRTVKDGRLVFDPPTREPVVGTVPAERPDSIQFQFYVANSGAYRLYFTSGEGEKNTDPMPLGIKVIEDLAPQVTITKPEDDEITVPANGQLAVDAAVTDDQGIDKLTLRMKLVQPEQKPLAARPYQEGKSFRRPEKDGTFSWPANLEYKDSVDFTKLTDEAGLPFELKEGMVLEYWLEATDNRTKPGPAGPEPDPNTGRSPHKTVRVGPPVVAPEDKQNLDQKKQQRNTEEKQHSQAQKQKLDNEPRDPNQKQDPNADNPPPPQGGMPEKKDGTDGGMNPPMMPPMGAPDMGNKKPPDAKNDNPMTAPQPKNGMPNATPMPMDGMGGKQPMPMSNPMTPDMGPNGMPEKAPMPSTQEQRDVERQAQDIQKRIDQQRNDGGTAKPGPAGEDQRTNPADTKPQPMGDMPPEPPKEGPKPGDTMNPMGGNSPANSKPAGNVQKPEDPATTKPEPKADSNPMSPMPGSTPPADPKTGPKNEPMTGAAGREKPTPKPQEPMNGTPIPPNQERSGGGSAKPATQQKEPDMGMEPMGGPQPKTPGGDAAKPKPMPSNDRATEKPSGEPMGGSTSEPNSQPENRAGMGKPQSGPPPADTKPAPMNAEPMPGGNDGMSETKPAAGATGDPKAGKPGAAEPKPDGGKPMGGARNSPQPGDDKPTPGTKGTGDQQPDPAKQKEFQDAVKNLASKDAAKQEAARQKLDKMVGQQNREKIEQNVKDFEKAANDLTSKDEATRKNAEQKLDQMVGQQNRKEMQDIAKGLNSTDPKEQRAAQEKLKNMQQKAGGEAPKGGNPDQKAKIDPKEVDQALKDLQSPDPANRDAAKEKLDKTFGQGAGDKAEQLQKDLNSPDPDKKAEAQKQIEDMQKKAEQMAKNGGEPKKDNATAAGKKVDPREVEKALDDLNSDDAKKRAEAKQKLDDMLGKGAGDKAEQINKDAKSGDFEKEAKARRERDDLMKKAEQMARKGENPQKGKPLSKEEIDQLAKKLDDLNSPDEAKRKAAEQEIDKQIGEQPRKKMQEAMKDPKKMEELKKQAEEMAKQGRGSVDDDGKIHPGGGDPTVPVREAMKEDARNRAKSAELQLEQFEKNKDNKELLKELDMTPDQYENFLKRFREETARLKKEADDLAKADATEAGPPTANISDGKKIDSRGGPSGSGSVGGPALAAPGYADALKQFQMGATKVAPKK